MHQSRALGAIQKVGPHVKGIKFPARKPWTPTIPKTGPQIPEAILALANKPVAAKKAKAPKVAKPEASFDPNNVRGRKPRFVDIEVDQSRANRAVSLLSAKRTIPHQYSTVKVDLSKANDLRSKLEQAGADVTLNDLVVRAASIALRNVPTANSLWSDEGLVEQQQLSIGVKQPVENGFETFMLPKASGTGAKNVQSRLVPHDNSTFVPISLIDLQSTNVNEFTGLVNENENGILTLGGVENGFGPNGQTQSMMLTLSADGRTLQMDTALELLDQVKSLVEEPKTMFL